MNFIYHEPFAESLSQLVFAEILLKKNYAVTKILPYTPASSRLFFFNLLISTSSITGSGASINEVLFSLHQLLFFSSEKGTTPTRYFLSASACHSSIHSNFSLGMNCQSSKLT